MPPHAKLSSVTLSKDRFSGFTASVPAKECRPTLKQRQTTLNGRFWYLNAA